jgi:prepilin-type N-terminal cleavage/methylation domain-containing protein
MRCINAPRRAFTLRELMAAIAVIGFLLALWPYCAVTSRVVSTANICRNNMRNIGLAMYNYEIARSVYPGYVNDVDSSASGTPNDRRSAIFVTLPYNDGRGLYESLIQSAIPNTYNAMSSLDPQGIGTELEVAICPADRNRMNEPAQNSYVVNTGQLDMPGSAARPADFAANGVFHKRVADVPGEQLISQTSKYIANCDGQAMTLMLSESADARSWTDVQERWTGFAYHHADGQPGLPGPNPLHALAVNVQAGQSRKLPGRNRPLSPPNPSPGYTRPSSYHFEVVNVMFCDAHVRPISNQISYRVFQALMTPDGRRARDNSLPTAPILPASHAAASFRIRASQIE